MLRSMTGFGASQSQVNDAVCSIEIRAVNNRFLKVISKLPETHSCCEGRLEKLVRERIRRGVVTVFVRLTHRGGATGHRLNEQVLRSYLDQLRNVGAVDGSTVGHVLALPGVLEEISVDADPEEDWPIIRETVLAAHERLDHMRRDEGTAMGTELELCCDRIEASLESFEGLVDGALTGYRARLCERVNALLAEQGVSVDPGDLIKEVAIFAERSDIAEEITRLRSHVAQFRSVLDAGESAGRKLEFLAQEMHRESNTIGSKANDVRISERVVDLKSCVEQVREIVQNVE